MFTKRIVGTLLFLAILLGFSAAGTMGADILFISALDGNEAGADDELKAFMEGLGHTVTYFDDSEDEAATEAAAATADVVFISESVGSANVNTEITEVEVPMIVNEMWAWDEMGLTHGGGADELVVTTNIEIVNPGHPLAAGLSGSVALLTDITSSLGECRLGKGIAGDEATVIATATLADGETYDILFAYEKGAALPVPPTDGSPRVAADIRVCYGFHEFCDPVLTDNAYTLLGAAINFALGIRPQPEPYSPNPANGQIEVPRDAVLSWKAGIYADKHNVYFGTNFDDVNDASVTDWQKGLVSHEQDGTTYDPPDLLEFGQTYYWRVDEVNAPPDSTIYKGDVWSFTTVNFLVVDDFEGYTDDEAASEAIWQNWIDGFGVDDNGAQAGNLLPPYAEQAIVHSGEQAMPFFYDNDMKYSEAKRTLVEGRDWTRDGVTDLSLWFRGNPPYVGSFVEGPVGTYTMTSTGTDIWDNADEFHFAFKEVNGSANIIARVASVENTQEFAKAGVMIRDTLDADSANVAVFITPENGVRFQYRNIADGSTDRQFMEGITAPQWVRLERTSGGLVRAYYSANGTDWERFTLIQVPMTMPVYVGLALTSHDVDLTCKAVFTDVSFPDTTVDPQWTDQDIGMLSNDAEPMYVALNGSAVVYHGDPNAALIDTWTEWVIPLQEFADKGIDLANVDSIAIGFGDRDNPHQPGGSGTMYFDDIRLYLPRSEP